MTLVLFEATGRYDQQLQTGLAAADIAFARVNPPRARHQPAVHRAPV